MSISNIGGSGSLPDSRSPVSQRDNQAGTAQTGNTQRKGGHANTPADAVASNVQDAVSISDRAADLQTLEAKVKSLPDVDMAKVEAVRNRIDNGEYQIDSARLADKMLSFEQQLGE